MTNPIVNDGILTQRPVPERQNETQSDNARAESANRTAVEEDPTVGRAQQRLTQEAATSEPGDPGTPDQARDLATAVRDQISADPQGALRAMRLVSDTLFEAATARPTA